MQLTLTKRVSKDTNAMPQDIKILKKALNRLGYYMPPSTKSGITSFADASMIDALKEFQRDQELKTDGVILPDGETSQAINSALDAQEKDEDIKLQWHCVDDGKSCDACVARDGTLVDDASENTPGCFGNCRCWVTRVENIPFIYDPPIEKVYPELLLLSYLPATRIGMLWRSWVLLGNKRDAEWTYAKFKSEKRWANQFQNRNWTPQQVTNALKYGKKYLAPNKVNPGNPALRYEHEGRFVVRDEITKEILQVGREDFIRNIHIAK